MKKLMFLGLVALGIVLKFTGHDIKRYVEMRKM
jgi:hypothetical protein